MAKIRIGLVGSGSIAPFHYNGFIKNEDAQVLGMCTRQGGNLEKLERMCQDWNIQAFRARRVLGEMQGEDIAQINAFYPDQAIGTIMQSWTSVYGDGLNGIKIIGPKGGLQVTDALYFNGEQLNQDASYAGSFVNQARAFTDAILHGRPPLSTLEDTRRTLKIIYGAYESCEQDKVIVF